MGVLLTSLQGCAAEDPIVARDAKLAEVELAVQSGDPDQLCATLGELFFVCSGQIAPSTGIEGAKFESQLVSENSALHIIKAGEFELVLSSRLTEDQEGKAVWQIVVDKLEFPEYSLPLNGSIAGIEVMAGDIVAVMPGDEAPEVVLSQPSDPSIEVSVTSQPGSTSLTFDAKWSPNAESTLLEEAMRQCENRIATLTLQDFHGGNSAADNFFRTNDPKFPKLGPDQRIKTKFDDGTGFESRWRTINNPTALDKGTCVAEIVGSSADILRAQWSTLVTFEGTIGSIRGSGFFAFYTGGQLQAKFESRVSGLLEAQIDRVNYSSLTRVVDEKVLEIPLRAKVK